MSFYQGSRLLESFADSIGIPLDQVNFMLCQLLALALSFAYRVYLHPKFTSPTVRHAAATSLGLILGFFCFGWGFWHMITQAALVYLIMRFAPADYMHILAFICGMVYLSVMHIYRMSYDYGGYMLDVTGPLMISTQKLTSLGFALHDGLYKKKEDLTPDQNQQAVREMPSPLVFSSYIFYFQGLLAGPMCFFTDYNSFVEGTNFTKHLPEEKQNAITNDPHHKEPDPKMTVIKKFVFSMFALWVALYIAPIYATSLNHDFRLINSSSFAYRIVFLLCSSLFGRARYYFAWKFDHEIVATHSFPMRIWYLLITLFLSRSKYYYAFLNDPEFIRTHSFAYRVLFHILAITFARGKYYFAWKFGEAINNAAGLGFNGYETDGSAKWDLVTNVNIRKLETATSLKVLIDMWNIQTAIWLRRICYDRAPKAVKTPLTYILSALWHGFYPGYYFTFIGAIFFTITARNVRRKIRPHFQKSRPLQIIYDIITWFFSQLSLAYLIVPFATLEFWPTVYFYTYSMYWFLHILVFMMMFALRFIPSPPRPDATKAKTS